MPKKSYVLDRIKVVSTCWEWQKYVSPHGYGVIGFRENGKKRNKMAHRLSYELFVGEVPKDLELDHLCRNRKCVNPDHLEAVTHKENVRRGDSGKFPKPWFRKTECVNGHTYTSINTYIKSNGAKMCKACSREAQRRFKLKLQRTN